MHTHITLLTKIEILFKLSKYLTEEKINLICIIDANY